MKKYDISTPVALKKGVYNLNGEANFNYQLNRVINWDGLESETGRCPHVAYERENAADCSEAAAAYGRKSVSEQLSEKGEAAYAPTGKRKSASL